VLFEKGMLKIVRLLFLFGVSLFIVMAILTSVHVLGRYAFNSPIYGQAEAVGLMQVIAISMAGAYTLSEKRHVAIGLLVDRLPQRIQAVIDFPMCVLCLVFTGLTAWQTIEYATSLLEEGQLTSLLEVPVSPFFYIIGIGWGLLSIAYIMLLLQFACKVAKK
jgi:TRAP-type C4-dicarboxylate transport system permease small subunit